MWVALALSYSRLGEAERIVLNLLGIWPQEKPFGAQDVEDLCPPSVLQAIAGRGVNIPTLLRNLYERSLLQREEKAVYRLHTVARDLVLHGPDHQAPD